MRLLLAAVTVFFPAAALYRIFTASVNVPLTDEWELADLAYAMHTGTLRWSMLWAPHNGHRELVGNVVFLVLDRLGGWNVVREQLLGLAFVIVALLLLRAVVRRTLPALGGDVVLAIASALLAGPLAYENFLVGVNFGWQYCTLGIVAVVERLTAGDRRFALPVAAAVALTASFSFAQGLVLWPCGFVTLLAVRARRMELAAWSALGAATFAAYVHGLDPGVHAPAGAAWLDAARYAAVFFGAPFRTDGTSYDALAAIGALSVALLLIASALALRDRATSRDDAPWLGLGLYALLTGALTTLERYGLGVPQAQSPRYIALSAFVTIAGLGLLVRFAGANGFRWARYATPLVVAAVVAGLAGSIPRAWTLWNDVDGSAASALHAIANSDPAPYRAAYPDPNRLFRLLDALKQIDDGPLDER